MRQGTRHKGSTSLKRIVPLVLAVALFMENMDSTVIATSLPAIASDIGTSPIALKLALTGYFVSLAIFIPISGRMADRFGAKRVFRIAIAVFVTRLARLRHSSTSLRRLRRRALPAGHGRRDDDAGRPARAGAGVPKADLVDAMAWFTDPGADRPAGRAAGRRRHHHLCRLALDLPDQPADRHRRHLPGRRASCRESRRSPSIRFDLPGFLLSGFACAGAGLRPVGRLACRPCRRSIGVAMAAAGLVAGALSTSAMRGATPTPLLRLELLLQGADAAGGDRRRHALPHRLGRRAVPLAADAAARLRLHAVPVGPDHLRVDRRRDDDEVPGQAASCTASASARRWSATAHPRRRR